MREERARAVGTTLGTTNHVIEVEVPLSESDQEVMADASPLFIKSPDPGLSVADAPLPLGLSTPLAGSGRAPLLASVPEAVSVTDMDSDDEGPKLPPFPPPVTKGKGNKQKLGPPVTGVKKAAWAASKAKIPRGSGGAGKSYSPNYC